MLLTQQSHLREFDFVVSFFLFLCNWLNGVGFISDIGRISYGTDRVAKVEGVRDEQGLLRVQKRGIFVAKKLKMRSMLELWDFFCPR